MMVLEIFITVKDIFIFIVLLSVVLWVLFLIIKEIITDKFYLWRGMKKYRYSKNIYNDLPYYYKWFKSDKDALEGLVGYYNIKQVESESKEI